MGVRGGGLGPLLQTQQTQGQAVPLHAARCQSIKSRSKDGFLCLYDTHACDLAL